MLSYGLFIELIGICCYFYFIICNFIIFGCTGSLLLCMDFSPVAASNSSLKCTGFSLRWFLLLSTGPWCTGFSRCSTKAPVVVAQRLKKVGSVVVACGIFLDQGSDPCPLHWQADSYPLCHKSCYCF